MIPKNPNLKLVNEYVGAYLSLQSLRPATQDFNDTSAMVDKLWAKMTVVDRSAAFDVLDGRKPGGLKP